MLYYLQELDEPETLDAAAWAPVPANMATPAGVLRGLITFTITILTLNGAWPATNLEATKLVLMTLIMDYLVAHRLATVAQHIASVAVCIRV